MLAVSIYLCSKSAQNEKISLFLLPLQQHLRQILMLTAAFYNQLKNLIRRASPSERIVF